MTPAMWDQTINELLSILAFLVVVTLATCVLSRRDKVRRDRTIRNSRMVATDRQKRMQR